MKMNRWLVGPSAAAFAIASVCAISSALRSAATGVTGVPTQDARLAFQYVCLEHGVITNDAQSGELLPDQPPMKTLLDLRAALAAVGLKTEVQRMSGSAPPLPTPPFIFALDGRAVVVDSSRDDGSVTIVDTDGLRRIVNQTSLFAGWRGDVLSIVPERGVEPLPQSLPLRPGKAAMQMTTMFVDAGELSRSRGNVEFQFPFKNVGLGPLRISKVVPSCGCVTVRYPEGEIAPGGTGTISAVYDVGMGEGPFSKAAVVYSNDERFPVIQLKLAGYIINQLSVSPLYVNFGRVRLGEVVETQVFVRYWSRDQMSISRVDSGSTDVSALAKPVDLDTIKTMFVGEPHRVSADNIENLWMLTLRYAPQSPTDGRKEATLRVHTNLIGSNSNIEVTLAMQCDR